MFTDSRPRYRYQLPSGEVIPVIHDHGQVPQDTITHQLLGGEIVSARFVGPAVTVPIAHLNGSGRSGLTRQYTDALMALTEAYETLQAASPHGRDYYVVPGSFEKARDEHQTRLDRIRDVAQEVAQILGSLEA